MPKPAKGKRPRLGDVRKAVSKTAVKLSSGKLRQLHKASDIYLLQCIPLDSTYRAVDVDTWEKILAWSRVDEYAYNDETRDCDNFAAAFHGNTPLVLKVNTVGYVVDISGRHAYNAVVCYDDDPEELRIALIEPQSDKWVHTGDTLSSHEAYKAQEGFVIWG